MRTLKGLWDAMCSDYTNYMCRKMIKGFNETREELEVLKKKLEALEKLGATKEEMRVWTMSYK